MSFSAVEVPSKNAEIFFFQSSDIKKYADIKNYNKHAGLFAYTVYIIIIAWSCDIGIFDKNPS